MNSIQINNVTKKYKSVLALYDVNITFKPHKIYGLLGRNGAGKSTLINLIANRVFPNEGSILIDDKEVSSKSSFNEKIFIMSEADYYDKNLRVKDHYKYTQEFYPDFDIEKANQLADKFGLSTYSRLKALSKGYKSIFKLTIALSMDVPYVIYDEPIQGLDANHRELFYKLVLEDYTVSNRTIIIATHLIEEVSNIIEDVVIIDYGRVIVNESVETLLSNSYSLSGKIEDIDEYTKDKNVISEEVIGGLKVSYILEEKPHDIPLDLEVSKVPLQKLFIHLTEKGGV